MRVIAGRWRGLKLKAPADDSLRPSSDRLRETLFNILAHNPRYPAVAGARFADIFAGTGAVGIEALSRGAAHVTFVESHPRHLRLLESNLARLRGLEKHQAVSLLRSDARQLPPARRPHDILYLDPPYGAGLIPPTLTALAAAGWVTPASLVIAETDGREDLRCPDGWQQLAHRRCGRAALHFLRWTTGPSCDSPSEGA
ncbi:MAG: 16S rRNA (guanine(966)-N(2))-methyltransferase RsmD [Alphaproteobacteria bacterium]|nr:MAG: 16S rRNA (guanine(966)-N(2))-methyltransferase RsmD [Alphaproteobacteria bacterium]